ncbi:MAG TPA: gamma-glutamylcyclotransferase family protein, partial [Pilimelia sp.]|nr:gamma-glutamylcyclotransferase family protein [Pilimelia sp.]
MRLYAAYGSNLDPARMRAYCPHSPMVGVGWLEDWRLTFAGEDIIGWEGAVTTVVESPGDRVFVALYDVHPWDAAQLDEIEGVTAGTYRKLTVRVAT